MRTCLAVAVGTLMASAPVVADPVTISGVVAYQEVVRLPAEAVATVRLVEDGAVIAQARVEEPRAPPIAFELVYDDSEIDADAGYALEAEIALGERTLFRSPAPQPLKSPASSQTVSLIVRLVRE